MSNVKPIPEEFHSITPAIVVKDAKKAIDFYKQAFAAGATEIMPPADMFWGDRFSSVKDPFGHSWSLATHVKEMTEEECQKACDEWMAQMAKGGGDCQ